MKSKIPVFIIAGYLGSGKTSFINSIVKNQVGLRAGVLVNDFGEVNIDALLIEKQVDELVTLSNGCLCCTLSNELDDSLNQLASADSELDAIFVEASGVADPAQMIELIFRSQNSYIEFKDLIYIIDATNFVNFYKDQTYLATVSINAGRLILMNKVDLASPDQILEIESIIHDINPRAVLVQTVNSEISSKLLFDESKQSFVQLKIGQGPEVDQSSHSESSHEHRHHDHPAHQHFDEVTIIENRPIDPELATKFLNNLPKGIYRAKGWVNFGQKSPAHKIYIQIVGAQHQLRAVPWESDDLRQTILVFIGPKFDKSELETKFKACIDQQPNHITASNLVNHQLFL